MMYTKNLTKDFRLRLSEEDMTFLTKLSEERQQSISEVTRSIIGEYRRSLDAMELLKNAMKLAQEQKAKEVEMSNGDTEANKHD